MLYFIFKHQYFTIGILKTTDKFSETSLSKLNLLAWETHMKHKHCWPQGDCETEISVPFHIHPTPPYIPHPSPPKIYT